MRSLFINFIGQSESHFSQGTHIFQFMGNVFVAHIGWFSSFFFGMSIT